MAELADGLSTGVGITRAPQRLALVFVGLVTLALPLGGTSMGAPPSLLPGAGAYLVKDISPNALPGDPQSLTVAADTLFFIAYDGQHGRELWKTDGTEAGTVLVKDIRPGPQDGAVFTRGGVGDTLYLLADDGVHGAELWKSDGTEAGTVLVKDLRPGPESYTFGEAVAFGNNLLFVTGEETHGLELWRSDGTEAGTVMVKDIRPGPDSSNVGGLVPVGSTLFFYANDGVNGDGLWKSDGTEAGTAMAKAILPMGLSGPRTSFAVADETLFFMGYDAVHGHELWKSDGTEAGTVLVKDVRPGAESSVAGAMGAIGGTAFFSADDGVHGFELWKSDGTESGTVRVKDIWPGPGTSSPGWYSGFALVGSTLFFEASDDLHRGELWKSDGTEEGTVLVREIQPGLAAPHLAELTGIGDRLYFQAGEDMNGPELWMSDGTEAGTVMVQDICPGTRGSNPRHLTSHRGSLYFNAFETVHGEELWAVAAPPALRVSPYALRFGAVTSGGVATITTPAQRVDVTALTAPVSWSVSATEAWLRVTAGAGTGTGAFTVSLEPQALPKGATSPVRGTLRIETAGTVARSHVMDVEVSLYPEGTSSGPFGFLDTPADGAAVSGAVAVTGWAVDDVDVDVAIYRDPVPGDPPAALSPNGKVFVGSVTFVPGARPDVERVLAGYPQLHRAGWGYMLLTNALPDLTASQSVGGNGTFVIHAYAGDAEGNTTLLGSATITADNAGATKPFGTIDVPGQGQSVTGTVAVFGWALTPSPAAIPADGSTIGLVVDGQAVGHPVYGQYRADIAALFPGYANSNGAVGYSFLDTTLLANGMHTIAWTVTDDQGRTEGIGSRFFRVQN